MSTALYYLLNLPLLLSALARYFVVGHSRKRLFEFSRSSRTWTTRSANVWTARTFSVLYSDQVEHMKDVQESLGALDPLLSDAFNRLVRSPSSPFLSLLYLTLLSAATLDLTNPTQGSRTLSDYNWSRPCAQDPLFLPKNHSIHLECSRITYQDIKHTTYTLLHQR